MKKREDIKKAKRSFNTLYSLAFASLIALLYIIYDIKNNLFFSNLDYIVNDLFSSINSQFIISLSKIITSVFDPTIFITLSFIFVFFLFYNGRDREAILYLVTTSLAFLVGHVLKLIFQRARPDNILVLEKTFSFPSTHSLMAVIFFGIIVYLIDLHIKSHVKKILLNSIATIFILIIGLTRLILSAHWFTDVISGFILGVFLLSIYLIIIRKEHILKIDN